MKTKKAVNFFLLSPSYVKEMTRNDKKRKTLKIRNAVIVAADENFSLSKKEKERIQKELSDRGTICHYSSVSVVPGLYLKTKKALEGNRKEIDYFNNLSIDARWNRIPYDYLVGDGFDTWQKVEAALVELDFEESAVSQKVDFEVFETQVSPDKISAEAEKSRAIIDSLEGVEAIDFPSEKETTVLSQPLATLGKIATLFSQLTGELSGLETQRMKVVEQDKKISELQDDIVVLNKVLAEKKIKVAELLDQLLHCRNEEEKKQSMIHELALELAVRKKIQKEALDLLEEEKNRCQQKEKYFCQVAEENKQLKVFKKVIQDLLVESDLEVVAEKPEKSVAVVKAKKEIKENAEKIDPDQQFISGESCGLPGYSEKFKTDVLYQASVMNFLDDLKKKKMKVIRNRIVKCISRICRKGPSKNMFRSETLKSENGKTDVGIVIVSPAHGYSLSLKKDKEKRALVFFDLLKK